MIVLALQLFWTFFQIGLFGFGGGYAMISMIHGSIVTDYHWMTPGQFTDIVAISQMTPGPIGINSATYVGYTTMVNAGYGQVMGVVGSFLATFAVVLPSFILMLIISKFLMKHRQNAIIDSMFGMLRPAVVGLLMAAALCLMTAENFSSPNENPWQFWLSVIIFLFAMMAVKVYKMNPILIICLCAVAGVIVF